MVKSSSLDQLVAQLSSPQKPRHMRRLLGRPGKAGGKPAYVVTGEKYGVKGLT